MKRWSHSDGTYQFHGLYEDTEFHFEERNQQISHHHYDFGAHNGSDHLFRVVRLAEKKLPFFLIMVRIFHEILVQKYRNLADKFW